MSDANEPASAIDDSADQDAPQWVKELRKQNRTLEKENKDLISRLEVFEERAATARDKSAEEIVNALGVPGLKDDVLEWVDGDLTTEKVAEVLKQKSIPVNLEGSASDAQGDPEPDAPSASEVGQRIAAAAAGTDGRSVDQRILEAETTEEVQAIMAEIGAIAQHS
jgi:hypothetical protein